MAICQIYLVIFAQTYTLLAEALAEPFAEHFVEFPVDLSFLYFLRFSCNSHRYGMYSPSNKAKVQDGLQKRIS